MRRSSGNSARSPSRRHIRKWALSSIRTREESHHNQKEKGSLSVQLREYIDAHYADPTLSLTSLGNVFSYNPKYISAVFKKTYRIGVSEYLRIIRIQSACTLIEEGLTSVSNIAFLCGFDDPLYFSKLFRNTTGISPREYIRERIENNRNKQP